MKILVTGYNRSGTSAISNLLAYASGCSILDDPQWAISNCGEMFTYKNFSENESSLKGFDIVKSPRMTEALPEILSDNPSLKVVFLFRDPKDVFCSIMDKVKYNLPTRMLDNKRFGTYSKNYEGVALGINFYTEIIIRCLEIGYDIILIKYSNFYFNKLDSILQCAHQLGLQIENYGMLLSKLETQLGPQNNKPNWNQDIKGPNRWKKELTKHLAEEIDLMTINQIDKLDLILKKNNFINDYKK